MPETQTTKKRADQAFLPKFWVGSHVGYPLEVRKLSLRNDFYLRKLLEYQYDTDERTALLFTNPVFSAWTALTVRGCAQTILRAVAYLLDKDLEWVKDNTTLAECFGLVMRSLRATEGKKEEPMAEGRIKSARDTWNLASLIVSFGQVFGWTADDVMSLTRQEIDAITEAIAISQKAQEKNKQQDERRRPINDARTKLDPSGVESVMAFAAEHRVLKGKEG